MTIACAYRHYPAWFGDVDPMVSMRELAHGAAKSMGRAVVSIEKIGHGFDRRGGHYLDYRVTYSSTEVLKEAR